MNDVPTAARLTTPDWFKSSYSAADNECVEVALVATQVGIRDSKDSARGTLTTSTSAFTLFVNATKSGHGIRIH